MTHYEERLEEDLGRIRAGVLEAARYAERAFDVAVRALHRHDDDLAYATILGDHKLNRDINELDRLCHAFIARHLPSAGHLRFVSSVLRMNVAIERIGDYAVTIARESVKLSQPPTPEICRDIEMMAKQSALMLQQANEAFAQGNAELARGTIAMAGQLDLSFDNVFKDLLDAGSASERPLADLFALLITFNRMERVSDQAKNLCEEVVFWETGETKGPKVYPIAFVDERNDCLSLMAAAIAAKAYPKGGRYVSAGWDPAATISPGFEAFMDRHGHSTDGLEPGGLGQRLPDLEAVYVIVGVGCDPRPHLPALPYHVVVQVWDVPAPRDDLDRERADAVLERCYKELAARIEDLMETLHGEGAD